MSRPPRHKRPPRNPDPEGRSVSGAAIIPLIFAIAFAIAAAAVAYLTTP